MQPRQCIASPNRQPDSVDDRGLAAAALTGARRQTAFLSGHRFGNLPATTIPSTLTPAATHTVEA